jgi:hypothetical protein
MGINLKDFKAELIPKVNDTSIKMWKKAALNLVHFWYF